MIGATTDGGQGEAARIPYTRDAYTGDDVRRVITRFASGNAPYRRDPGRLFFDLRPGTLLQLTPSGLRGGHSGRCRLIGPPDSGSAA